MVPKMMAPDTDFPVQSMAPEMVCNNDSLSWSHLRQFGLIAPGMDCLGCTWDSLSCTSNGTWDGLHLVQCTRSRCIGCRDPIILQDMLDHCRSMLYQISGIDWSLLVSIPQIRSDIDLHWSPIQQVLILPYTHYIKTASHRWCGTRGATCTPEWPPGF